MRSLSGPQIINAAGGVAGGRDPDTIKETEVVPLGACKGKKGTHIS